MGKHSEWRKLAKKARRKRIRQSLAKARDEAEKEAQRKRELSPNYHFWLEEQRKADEFQKQEEIRIAEEQHSNWIKREIEAHKQWQELQKKLELAREERAKQNAKIRMEWEKEQQKLKEIKEKNEKELEERRKQQEKFNEELTDFIVNGGNTPEHLKTVSETNPAKDECPFFKKTSACRFGDVCSRNHKRPGVSKILLIPNFYTHYSLEQHENEHGTDSSLEFENNETYDDFKEFFYDVLPEMETCGRVLQFKVCCNKENHLRGNVYVEYATTRAAVISYHKFNGRFYAGKQLNVEFCDIQSWKSAICGLHFAKKCPKGSTCNFLHVFRNPQNMFHNLERKPHTQKRISVDSDRRNWRWSESPERSPGRKREHSVDWEANPAYEASYKYKNGHKSRSHSRDRHSSSRRRKHRRSRSREKHKSRSRSERHKNKSEKSDRRHSGSRHSSSRRSRKKSS